MDSFLFSISFPLYWRRLCLPRFRSSLILTASARSHCTTHLGGGFLELSACLWRVPFSLCWAHLGLSYFFLHSHLLTLHWNTSHCCTALQVLISLGATGIFHRSAVCLSGYLSLSCILHFSAASLHHAGILSFLYRFHGLHIFSLSLELISSGDSLFSLWNRLTFTLLSFLWDSHLRSPFLWTLLEEESLHCLTLCLYFSCSFLFHFLGFSPPLISHWVPLHSFFLEDSACLHHHCFSHGVSLISGFGFLSLCATIFLFSFYSLECLVLSGSSLLLTLCSHCCRSLPACLRSPGFPGWRSLSLVLDSRFLPLCWVFSGLSLGFSLGLCTAVSAHSHWNFFILHYSACFLLHSLLDFTHSAFFFTHSLWVHLWTLLGGG